MNEALNIKTGTINFWIPTNLFDYNDNKSNILCNKSTPEGSILILKDRDNKLKFFHVLIGKGRTDVEIDVCDLDSNERHMVSATWDIENTKRISLYIDGGKRMQSENIEYASISQR